MKNSYPARGRTTKLMVPVEDLRELMDMARVGSDAGLLARCKGARWYIRGYLCTHCGKDTSKPGYTCGAPAARNLPQVPDDVRVPVEFE